MTQLKEAVKLLKACNNQLNTDAKAWPVKSDYGTTLGEAVENFLESYRVSLDG